ncbi:hypothetical protein Tco_1297995 [Tanacetum coccineum]
MYSAKKAKVYSWFKEKLMLVEAQEAGQILNEEQLAFLADHGISEPLVAEQTISQNSAFQTDDLDAYDLDCDDLSSAKAVLMANLSSCGPEVLSEIPYSDSYPNDMINQDVQEMQYSEQTHVDHFKDNEIHSGSNIIPYLNICKRHKMRFLLDTNPSAPRLIYMLLSLVDNMTDHVVMEKLIDSQMDDLIHDRNAKLAAFQQEINTLKETLSNNVKEKESLSKTLTVFKTESKEKESNQQRRISTKLYIDGSVIAKEHAVISVIDDEETLILEEESRSKMLEKQNDPILIEKKIKNSPIDNSKFNKIKEDFEAVVDQCSLDKNIFEIQIKQLRIDNDQLLNQIMSQEIVHIVVNFVDILNVKKSSVNNCNKCLELEMELFKKKYFIEKRFTINLSSGKLVAITSINKDKRVRFAEPVT